MPYKPKYCCQCGEKIDRINWKPWSSRRFCELCETDFAVYDWLTRTLFAVGLLLGLFGIGMFFQKPEQQLNLASSQFSSSAANAKSEAANQKTTIQTSTNDNIQPTAQISNSTLQEKPQIAPLRSNLTNKQAEILPNVPPETIYFCGAQTKKGTLCSRRIKGGGRCWQHVGQTAMLPQTKLITSQ